MQGERLKNLRKSKNMTQEQLAELFNVEKSTICTYEKGRRNPPYKIIKKYIETFGVGAEYLMGIDILSVREDSPLSYFTLTKEEMIFITDLRDNKMIYDILLTDPKRGMEIIKRKIG